MFRNIQYYFFILTLLVTQIAWSQINDDFDTYGSINGLRQKWSNKSGPELAIKEGVNGTQAAKLGYNGQQLLSDMQLQLKPSQNIVIEADIRLMNQSDKSLLRFSFGDSNINWKTFQGRIDMRVGKLPYVHGKSKPDHAIKLLEKNHWYHVKIQALANGINGGKYSVWIDGLLVAENVPYTKSQKNATTHLRIGYLSRKSDGSVFIDNLKAIPGKTLSMNLQDMVNVQLPKEPELGWRFDQDPVVLPLEYKGEKSLLSKVRVAVFANHQNHPDQAEKTATATLLLTPTDQAQQTATFEHLSFGMYTLRIDGQDAKGKWIKLDEQLIARMHPTPPTPPAYPPTWAICTHADRFDRKVDIDMPALKLAGSNWSRMEFIWGDMYKDGKYDFSHHDYMYKVGHENDVQFFGLLNTTAKGTQLIPGSGWGCAPNLDAWEKHCRITMMHFKNRIKYWEIWNEPDGYSFWWFIPGVERPEIHAKMIQVAAKVAKSISPDIKVMGPSVTRGGNSYLQSVADHGGLDDIDIISHHVREYPHLRTQFYERLMAQKMPGKKFTYWISEGANDFRTIISSFAGLAPQAGFAYTIRDKGYNRKNFEHNNGMLKRNGLPKDRFIQYQFLSETFSHATYIGQAMLADGVDAFVFKFKDTYRIALWPSDDHGKPITMPTLLSDCKIYDALGNPRNQSSITPKQMVIIKDISANHPVMVDASINCLQNARLLQAQGKLTLDFTMHNPTQSTKQFVLTLDPHAHLTLGNNVLRFNVKANQTITKQLHVKLGKQLPVTPLYLTGRLTTGNQILPQRFGPFLIEDQSRQSTLTIDDGQSEFKWHLPKMGGDLHTTSSTGVARKKLDQESLSAGSSIRPAIDPTAPANKVIQLNFNWKKPGKVWKWLSRSYLLKQPFAIPGVPTKLSMNIYMPDHKTEYPKTILLLFKDPTGKLIRVEGGEVYWSGWRRWDCYLPSMITHGFIHSVKGGNGIKAIDAYPLTFEGLVLNLPPSGSIIHFSNDQQVVKGHLLIDDIQIQTLQ